VPAGATLYGTIRAAYKNASRELPAGYVNAVMFTAVGPIPPGTGHRREAEAV
jgi:hypothetical protein